MQYMYSGRFRWKGNFKKDDRKMEGNIQFICSTFNLVLNLLLLI